MKNKRITIIFLFISFIKSINIGNKTLVSDFRLPGNNDIIFLSLVKSFNTVFTFHLFQLMDDQQKYF